jgi:phage terminase Nu1 subunit (DNA packaging protein)
MLTRRDLATALGVHMQTVTKWERDGMPIARKGARGKPSRYDRSAVEAWLHARDNARQTSDVASLELERSRRERAQALLALQTYQMRAKELLPRAEVDRVWSQHVSAVRAKLLSLPVTLADRVHHAAKMDGVASVERILNEAVRDVLRELAGTAE